jgi:(2S)-methylsuccinyl-CoA dehydrogenase
MIAPDLQRAAAAIDAARDVLDKAAARLAGLGDIDANQVLAYDLAHATAAVEMSGTLLDYGGKGDAEARIACAFAADAVGELAAKLFGR